MPWALSKYTGKQTVLDIRYTHAEELYLQELIEVKIRELHGIDICRKSIDVINSHVGDIRHTDLPENFFDLIFAFRRLSISGEIIQSIQRIHLKISIFLMIERKGIL